MTSTHHDCNDAGFPRCAWLLSEKAESENTKMLLQRRPLWGVEIN